MAVSEKELELQLMEAGNRLVEPPPSVDELIPLLDQVESCLSRVEQSPSQSMQNALSPSLKALVAEHLFRHPDVDVKVAVAACISEITRITAPDAPFDDDQMREVFQLIVSSFENLSDKCSRSYIKRTSILEIVAKVRSCVVMLDLECDDLIVEMFQHFLKAIRDYHPLAVFTSMVTIMSLVLEESEDIPMELLSSILASVKIDNEEVLPVARRLAEKVLKNCASKLRPYLTQAVENLGISYDYYSSVVASVCQVTARVVDSNDAASGKHLDDESILVEAPLEKAAQEDKQIPEQAVSTEKVDLANEKSPKAVVCNGILQTAEDDSLADLNSVKKEEGDHIADKSKNETSPVAEPYISKAEEVVNSDPMLEQNTQEKERKSDSKLTEPSDSSHVDEKAVETSKDQKNDSKDDAGSQHLSVGGAVSSENRKTDVQHSSQKATKEEFNDVASPTPSGTDSHSTRAARPKRKDGASKETTSSVDDVSKATSDSEAKTNRRSGKEVAAVVSSEDNAPVDVDETKKESDTASDSEAKSLKKSSKKVDSSGNNAADQTKKESALQVIQRQITEKSSKKVDSSGNNADESTSRQLSDKKRRGWGKVPEKDRTKTLIKKDNEASDSMEYGENLVGLKVKVWWPKDREFYEGFIYSFDPSKQKHKVHYNDGDQEILNLKREKWAVIEDESGSDEEGAANHSSPDGSSDIWSGLIFISPLLIFHISGLKRREKKHLISLARKLRWVLR
ncbi:protein IWS1 homolog isoform X2 [Hibiscus syriacus]|uniref:protein IWS1 homolog isoform X2 n=1 Tax=Hibiscus syriacus TaxID=106335 RepID=UPI001921EA29|nr:protein IWS1 homolog isoform X2 [Hibiscus syriacus]